MKSKDVLLEYLHDMEDYAVFKNIHCPPIYLLGGSGCILGGYLERATTDFDLIDMDYPAYTGKLFRLLERFDMLDWFVTPLSPDFRERTVKLEEFKHIDIFILSREDIIVSKLSRYSEKDIEDIRQVIVGCSKSLIKNIIENTANRKDFSEKVKRIFLKNADRFKENFNV